MRLKKTKKTYKRKNKKKKVKTPLKKLWQNEACSLCFNKFKFMNKKSPIIVTSCGELFHRDCLESYVNSMEESQKKIVCPVCKGNLFEIS